MPKPSRPLFIFAKPPAAVVEKIAAHPRYNRKRRSDLLHATILGLFDINELPPEALPLLKDLMRDYEDIAAPLLFDRIEERRAVTLRSSRPLIEAAALQSRLIAFLEGRGFSYFGEAPPLHVTINYEGDGLGSQHISPIGWTIDELLLVESPYGETRHIVHGRWRLRDLGPKQAAA